jgi:heme/copper-type cytochrome/quinol oxidase subunit 2
MKRRIQIGAIAIGLVCVSLQSAAHACSVCIGGAAGDRLTDAFNWSVLFLMAMPYSILASVAGFFFYSYRRAARKAGAETAKTPALNLAWTHKESGR